MKKLRFLVIYVALLAVTILSGCTSTPEHLETGFLSNYDELKTSEEFEDARVYLAPNFSRGTVGNIEKIQVVPFEVWLQANDAAVVSSEQLTKLVLYFHSALNAALSNNYQMVDTPGPDTLTIRGAFSAIKIAQPELSPTDFIPFRMVLNAGNAAYLSATEQQDLVTQVGIEVEFKIGAEASPLFAMTNVKTLDTRVNNSKSANLDAVKQVLDNWVENFVVKLAEVRNSTGKT